MKKGIFDKKNIIFLSVILFIFVIGGIVFFMANNKLSKTEEKVVLVLNDYKPRLKNPSTLQVFDIRYKESYDKENNLKLDVYIDTSAQNGFGGNTRDRIYYIVYSDNKVEFVGSDSKANYSITSYTSKSEESEINSAREIYKTYEELKNNDSAKINVKKVMKKVK